MRLDQLLVQLKLAPSRTKAQELIERGAVRVQHKTRFIKKVKPSDEFDAQDVQITVDSEEPLLKYASRAGLKLEGALKHLARDVKGLKCLDVGISTGGFTDCLLQHKAGEVVGIDVGTGQLHPQLAQDKRLKHFENLNVRELAQQAELAQYKFDLIVVDVSFISLEKVLPILYDFLVKDGALLALVKPQFELSAKALDKKGVVKSAADIDKVKERLSVFAADLGFKVQDYFAAVEPGRDGNQEFFIYAKK